MARPALNARTIAPLLPIIRIIALFIPHPPIGFIGTSKAVNIAAPSFIPAPVSPATHDIRDGTVPEYAPSFRALSNMLTWGGIAAIWLFYRTFRSVLAFFGR
jgi:hypothetical protein